MNREPIIRMRGVSFQYPERTTSSISGIDLAVEPGEAVCLAGPTGCGKSTLLRCLNGLIPHETAGRMSGSVFVNGWDTAETAMGTLCQQVGMVFQSPDDQLFSTTVADEIAFGLENLGLPRAQITARMKWALEVVGLQEAAWTPLQNLSGGQKQRVAIASVLAMQPKLIALDEPTSQLDPAGSRQVLDVLAELRQQGLTVILAEHRLAQAVPLSGRLWLMEEGKLVLDSATASAFADSGIYGRLGLRLPPMVELFARLGQPEQPLSLEEAARLLEERMHKVPGPAETGRSFGDVLLQLSSVRFAYGRGRRVIDGVDLTVRRGERVAIMGPNGGGKSTLLGLMAGALHPSGGRIELIGSDARQSARSGLAGRVGLVVQNPDLMLMCESVRAEVADGPSNLGMVGPVLARHVDETLEAFGLERFAGEPPLALSKGQRLRVALASVLSMAPTVLLLDEPTTGQDRHHIELMMDHLAEVMREGAVVFCTHDTETVLRHADRVILLVAGQVLADGRPLEVLSDEELLSHAALVVPEVIRLCRRLGMPSARTVEELATRLKGAIHA